MHLAKEPPETSAAQAIDFLVLLQNLKVVVAVHDLSLYIPIYAKQNYSAGSCACRQPNEQAGCAAGLLGQKASQTICIEWA